MVIYRMKGRAGDNVDKIIQVTRSFLVSDDRKLVQSAQRKERPAAVTLTEASGFKTKHGDLRKEAQSIIFKTLVIADLYCQRTIIRRNIQNTPGKETGTRADALASK